MGDDPLDTIRELVDQWGGTDADNLNPLDMWEQLNTALDNEDAGPTCHECGRPVIQQRTWEKATPNQRQGWLNAGVTTLQGRGLCRPCYLKAWRAGHFPKRTTGTPAPRKQPCTRCGIETTDQLCHDCKDATADTPLWDTA